MRRRTEAATRLASIATVVIAQLLVATPLLGQEIDRSFPVRPAPSAAPPQLQGGTESATSNAAHRLHPRALPLTLATRPRPATIRQSVEGDRYDRPVRELVIPVAIASAIGLTVGGIAGNVAAGPGRGNGEYVTIGALVGSTVASAVVGVRRSGSDSAVFGAVLGAVAGTAATVGVSAGADLGFVGLLAYPLVQGLITAAMALR